MDDNTGVDDLFSLNGPINKSKIIQCNVTNAPTVDMKAISYESEMNMLNSTIWFSKAINNVLPTNTPINTNKNINKERRRNDIEQHIMYRL